MSAAPADPASGARKLQGAMLDRAALSIERLPGLAIMLDECAGQIAGALATLFPTAAKGAIEDIRMTSLLPALKGCEGLPAALLRCPEFDARFALILDEGIVDVVAGAVFADDVGRDRQSTRATRRTAIEQNLLEEFARRVAEAMQIAIAGFAEATVVFERLVVLADNYPLGKRDMPAVLARLIVTTSAGAADCLLALPQSLLLPLRNALSAGPASEVSASDPRWSQRMEDGVTQARLPIAAVLQDLPMTLGEVAQFEVGRLLHLPGEGIGPVRLDCAGRAMFVCRLGQEDDRYALEIEDVVAPESEWLRIS